MAEDFPEHLYRYRSLSDSTQIGFVEDILLRDRLYWPSPAQFNDPFDCFPVPALPASRHERSQYARALIKRNAEGLPTRHARRERLKRMESDNLAMLERELPKLFRSRIETTGVCSLTEACDSVLMWSHYADSHRGICLRFTPTELDRDFFYAPKVIYSKERPALDLLSDDLKAWAEKILLTKADYWEYEREWRAFDVHRSGFHDFRPGMLTGVILGALTSDENRDACLIGSRGGE